ncbi:MAG TPA: murein biosynthesis integral membrane protein MurJ [Phycicoccus sp.]|nr:murein biosynthesis integral membrane protein MurJ [Phycicoccus sp.]HQY96911.1 murein biosynthesis integral membrane protein MurJ [Phycicoccus sp.]HRA44052.1 murein biosynthesis integral membrane protein MurJ [Phycicoccus sp.]
MSSDRPSPGGGATVARSGVIMAAGTLTSRILGVVRVSLLAGIIGTTGLSADAFGVANTLPNQFYLIVAGGVLNAVLVPQIVKAMKHPDGGQEFVNRIVTLALAFLLAATVLVTVAAPLLVSAYSKVKAGDAFTLAVAFAFICLPQVFFYGLYTLLGQILTANNRFAAYMWAPVVANIVSLGGLLLFLFSGQPRMAGPSEWTPTMIWILGGSSTLSIAMQALCLIVPLRRMGFRYRPVWGFRGVGLGSASKVAGWTFAAVLVAQLGFIITSKVLTRATDLLADQRAIGPGRATFDNAYLLFMLPHSLVTVSLVTALFTRMATSVQARNRQHLAADLLRGLRMPAVILVPGVLFVIAFADVITRVLFPGNSYPQTHAVAVVVMALYCGVIPFGWFYLSERFFYAHEDARTPFFIQLVVTAISQTGALIGATLDPRHTAIAVGLGQSIAYAVGGLIGFALIRRRLGRLGLGGALTAYARLGIPALASAALLWLLLKQVAPDLWEGGPLLCLAWLAVAGPIHLLVTLGAAHLLKVREVQDLVGPLVRRLRRG